MKIEQLLAFIPDKDLEFISAETKIDFQVKKLRGVVMFKLILYSMLSSNKSSLRVMENFFHSVTFKTLSKTGDNTTKFNFIRDRIVTMSPVYFENIFQQLFDKFNTHFKERNAIQQYDSTMVGISSNLVEWGMKIGHRTGKRQLKYTIGLHGSFPCHLELFTDPKSLCEDLTIPPAIFNYQNNKNGIIVFDRGVQDRKTFLKFSADKILFVTRLKRDAKYAVVSTNKIKKHDKNSSVKVTDDLVIRFQDRKNRRKLLKTEFRLVKAIIKETNETICFLTNITDLSCYEIAAIYKQRWEIEVFFQVLKTRTES